MVNLNQLELQIILEEMRDIKFEDKYRIFYDSIAKST